MDTRSRRYTALFVVAAAALFPPMLAAFNRPEWVGGFPLLPLYVFGVWTAVVILARLGDRGDGSP